MRTLILFLAAGCLFLFSCSSQEKAPPGSSVHAPAERKSKDIHVKGGISKELGIRVTEVREVTSSLPIAATGQLQVNEDASWIIGAITDGRIISVATRVGDAVRQGQVLALLHSHDVHDARAVYRQAVAELARGQVMADQARTVRDRTRRLLELRAASREQFEAAEASYKSASNAVAALQADVDKAKFHLTEFLEVPVDAPDTHDSTTPDGLAIKSPAAGTVMERKATVGTVVSAGDPVFTVTDLKSLWLIAAVNEADMSRIHPGQRVQIAVRAYTDRQFAGRVLKLGERLDPQTRTLQVRVLVPNGHGLLKPDMFATAEFQTADTRPTLQVPDGAVQHLNGKQIVFVRTADGAYSPREITTGSKTGGFVEIVTGLRAGEPVVVEGAYLLKSHLMKEPGN